MSDNGDKIAFHQKDQSSVADYPLLDIETTPGSLDSINKWNKTLITINEAIKTNKSVFVYYLKGDVFNLQNDLYNFVSILYLVLLSFVFLLLPSLIIVCYYFYYYFN